MRLSQCPIQKRDVAPNGAKVMFEHPLLDELGMSQVTTRDCCQYDLGVEVGAQLIPF